ncbi:phosphatidylserine decarboxylase [Aphanomyces invadans]|uniref:phosphatidylserine decarboxylase n=1 Tax=Aphanomyces invadans TaxID=157072 RepID=A0A024TNA7_9STRA|nr:phosphatidylserine decarboxylase [Aphanomyces invadans]ETV95469.1 phosphatidylserine decarboxylase [Aphanomyces invadans]|eukprot:XP_008875662.1 phosphatidylserine decarboxylase [Aphanomyces invadans]
MRLPGKKTAAEARIRSKTTMLPLNVLPYRFISRVWGAVNDINLPSCLREPVYRAWTHAFDCQLDEMQHPLREYKNLGEFFSRQLKDGIRPVDMDPQKVCSPVDGRISTIGTVECTEGIPVLEQIKAWRGVRYRLDEFLGDVPEFFTTPRPGKALFHCVIYLAPGDYHRIHSPIDWHMTERRHFPGNLFPVNSLAVATVPSLFTWNERVVLLGQWAHGFHSLTAVGATNVGSILLDVEPELTTNMFYDHHKIRPKWGACRAKVYDPFHSVVRGTQVGQFKLGSTVVLVFEAPADFTFTVIPGDKVRYGQAIGLLPRAALADKAHPAGTTATSTTATDANDP